MDRKILGRRTAGRWNKIGSIQRRGRDVKSSDLGTHGRDVLGFGREDARRGGNDARTGQQARRSAICAQADVFEDARKPKEVILVGESETESVEIQVWLGDRRRAKGLTKQDHMGALVRSYLCGNVMGED